MIVFCGIKIINTNEDIRRFGLMDIQSASHLSAKFLKVLALIPLLKIFIFSRECINAAVNNT